MKKMSDKPRHMRTNNVQRLLFERGATQKTGSVVTDVTDRAEPQKELSGTASLYSAYRGRLFVAATPRRKLSSGG